jgi:hypothetical protein
MTWWLQTVRAAWDRWDAWRERRDSAFDADPQVVEIRRINRESGGGVEDTGVVTPTALALAEIAPHVPAQRTGRRHHKGRHRLVIPDQPVRKDES